MRYFSIGLLIVLSFLLAGCFEITEEVTLKRDGSGHYQVKMDLSEFLSSPIMEQALAEELKKDPSEMENMELDSTVTFAEMDDIPAGLTTDEKALLENLTLHMDISQSKEKIIVSMNYPFASLAEYERLNTLMNRLSAEEEAAKANGETYNNPFSMLGGLDDFNSSKSTFVLNGKTLERKVIKEETMEEEEEEMQEEAMELMKALMGDITFKTIYHLPGKVKKTTFENAEVNGKTVTVTYDIVEMMENKSNMAGTIKFK